MSRTCEPATPRKVNGYWYLVRPVLAEFARLDKRKTVMRSSRIRVADDPHCIRARKVVEGLDAGSGCLALHPG